MSNSICFSFCQYAFRVKCILKTVIFTLQFTVMSSFQLCSGGHLVSSFPSNTCFYSIYCYELNCCASCQLLPLIIFVQFRFLWLVVLMCAKCHIVDLDRLLLLLVLVVFVDPLFCFEHAIYETFVESHVVS